MAEVDPELLAGARLLAAGRWREAHEVFEARWRSSEGNVRTLSHALAQLGAALLKWSEDRPHPTSTLLGRVRQRLRDLPSRVGGLHVDRLESQVLNLEERLALAEPAPAGLRLSLGKGEALSSDSAALEARCPYCGESVTVQVEPTGAELERYVEDCPVCCRPWQVHVRREGEATTVQLSREDD